MGDGRMPQKLNFWPGLLCVRPFLEALALFLMQQTIMEGSEQKPVYMSLVSHLMSFSSSNKAILLLQVAGMVCVYSPGYTKISAKTKLLLAPGFQQLG